MTWKPYPFEHEFVDRRGRRARVSTTMLHQEVFCCCSFIGEDFELEETETEIALCYDLDDGTYVDLNEWERDSWLDEHKQLLLDEFQRRRRAERDAEIAQSATSI